MATTIWLTHLLSQTDHRMKRVQPWAERRLETLRGCSDAWWVLRDLGDDRLADILRHLSDDGRWRAFEQELTGQLQVRVYDLRSSCVRVDGPTASSYGTVSEDGLLQLGHSKDHRPDLPQLKVMLATLDPLGLPLATEVLSGQRADDPLYLPAIARVRACLSQQGLLYVGDCKMAALETRASIQAHADFYLCPLSAVPVPSDRLAQELAALRARGETIIQVERPGADGQPRCIAQGYERSESITAQIDGASYTLDGTTIAGALGGSSAGGGKRLAEAPDPSPDGGGPSLGEAAEQACAVGPSGERASRGRHRGALPGGRTARRDGWYCLFWWWIIRSTSANTLRAGFFVMRQSGQATSSWSEAPSDCSCWHVHRPPHDITLPPYLA